MSAARRLRLRAGLALAAPVAVVLGVVAVPLTGVVTGPATAEPPLFDRLPGFELPEGTLDGERVRVRPEEYVAYDVDLDRMAGRLAQAPSRRAAARGADPVEVEVAGPDGARHTFAVVEDPVVQAGLRAAHPELRTYAGRDVADPTRTVRLDLTPLGFHASVRGLGGRETWYVDPAVDAPADGGSATHLAYHRADLPEGQELAFEEVLEGASRPVGRAPAARAARTEPGAVVTRRTYRLALVSDPTYAQYFGEGGQPADPDVVLAEKVTLVNRVNQIYNDDLAIHMVLVDGTEDLNLDTVAEALEPGGPCGANACYDPADIDPEEGAGCTGSLLDRNQFVVGQLIGADRYDVGHIMLGINGGGVAYLGSVGEDTRAGGCTGLPFPEGDFMAIDYVAHEIGHQFAGNHTFNGVEGACSGLNRNGGTSVEPGSGSSVMAYAGICGPDDLQPHTDPYFSQRTIDEATAHVTRTPSTYDEVQTVAMRGFDGADSITLSYPGAEPVTVSTSPLSYNALGLADAVRRLTGFLPVVTAYDDAVSPLVDGDGFTLTFSGPTGSGTDVERITVTSAAAGFSAHTGVQVQGGAGTNQGSTVAPTSNRAPVVTAPADRTIPQRTPFTLTGGATDPDGDELLHLWEQNDEGGLTGTALTSGTKTDGPLFRVFGTTADVSLEDSLEYESPGQNLATGDPSRTFPDLAQVLADHTNAATGACPPAPADPAEPVPPAVVDCYAEFLPTSARDLTFRLTARDLFPIGGGTQHDDVVLTVGSAGPFRVTSQPAPSAGAGPLVVEGGRPGTVTWDVAGTGTAEYATDVRVLLSTDGGTTFPTVLAASTPNDGSAEVTWPLVDTEDARLRVEAVGNYFFDVNRADFTIDAPEDTTAPRTRIVDGPPVVLVRKRASVALGADEEGVTYACGLDGQPVDCADGTATLRRLGAGTHVLTAAATDAAGNTDATPERRTFTVPFGDGRLRPQGGGWTRVEDPDAWGGSARLATTPGRSLVTRVEGVTRVALVVTRGPRAGRVEVSLGGQRLGVLGLEAPRQQPRSVLTVARLDEPRSGRLVVTTVGGGSVRVEGIALLTPS